MATLKKILVANRGEIAVRIMRTAKSLGYDTVAVFSEADADAQHVLTADEAVLIGPAAVAESYLVISKIIDAAKAVGADAIHPGYGFLSENADFANACEDAEIVFIGPGVDAIKLMGSKRESKIAMIKAGVPCVPGYEGDDQSDEVLIAESKKIGCPVMVKASAGGGGKGMRLVADESELSDAIRAARSEAENAFGNGVLIIEKAIAQPRHIEIQVFADTLGNVVHLGERDCSIQRRHQKVIEESPSPVVDETLRGKMGAAAVDAAKSCGYVGAGTVEFLLDSSGKFYFLEMNTRLQVEHPVTEMVTGIDLVEWQINVAAGEPLPLTQDEIRFQGHAIEARLYAEDPAQNFMPQTGTILRWNLPNEIEVRVDHGVGEGQKVSAFYDPMLAKIIAHGETRDKARRKLAAALRKLTLLGVTTNKTFLADICQNQVFAQGEATTAFIEEQYGEDLSLNEATPDQGELKIAALLFYLCRYQQTQSKSMELTGWRSGSSVSANIKLACHDDHIVVTINAMEAGVCGERFEVSSAAIKVDSAENSEPATFNTVIEVIDIDESKLTYMVDNVRRTLMFSLHGDRIYLDLLNGNLIVDDITNTPPQVEGGVGSGKLVAPMEGAITDIFKAEGDVVEKGQLILVMEAMKMEHQIKADVDGIISKVSTDVGAQVKTKQLLVEIEPNTDNEE